MTIDSDKRSDAEIYDELAVALIRFATVLVGPSNAQDVVSSAVLRSLANPGWNDVQNRRGYLYQAVANESRRSPTRHSRRDCTGAGRPGPVRSAP